MSVGVPNDQSTQPLLHKHTFWARLLARQGGRRALATTLWTPLRLLMSPSHGCLSALPPDFLPRRLVYVCSGNICRSPYAEHVARACGLPSTSRGLRADRGASADPVALRTAGGAGIDLSKHRAAPFDPEEITPSDLVLAFELDQVTELRNRLRGSAAPVRLAGMFSDPLCWHIHDPYGLSDAYFERCFDRVRRSVLGVRKRLVLDHAIT